MALFSFSAAVPEEIYKYTSDIIFEEEDEEEDDEYMIKRTSIDSQRSKSVT